MMKDLNDASSYYCDNLVQDQIDLPKHQLPKERVPFNFMTKMMSVH